MQIIDQNKQWFFSEIEESIHHLCHTYFSEPDETGNAKIEEFEDGLYTEIDAFDLRIALEDADSYFTSIIEQSENIKDILENSYQSAFCKELAFQYCVEAYESDSFDWQTLAEYAGFPLSDSDIDIVAAAAGFTYRHIFAANDLNGEIKIFIQ